MPLRESRLWDGRISRSQLQHHLYSIPAIPKEGFDTWSSKDFEMHAASLQINIEHTNSCLQRTMIRHWRCGCIHSGSADAQYDLTATTLSPDPKRARLQLLQQERQRSTFIKEYRAAYAHVSIATDRLDTLLQSQRSNWHSQSARHKEQMIAAVQDTLHSYFEDVADLVMNLLPGTLFLEVYTQEDPYHILGSTQANFDHPASCLSTHLPLCASG